MDSNGIGSKEWYKPSEIYQRGLIVNTKGKPDYGYVLRLIKNNKLQARDMSMGKTAYYQVHITEIQRFNYIGLPKPAIKLMGGSDE